MKGSTKFSHVLCMSSAIALLGSTALRPQDGSTDPCTWISTRMLEGLSPDLLSERQTLVADSLARFPGSGETFIVTLMNASYQQSQWKDPGLALFYPLPPALQGAAWGGRGTVYSLQPGRPAEITLGGAPDTSVTFELLLHGTVSPLLLDLDRDGQPGVPGGIWEPHAGVDLSGGHLVAFDIDGDRFEDITEWVTGEDGLVVEPEEPGKVVADPQGLIWSGSLSGRDLLGMAGGWKDGFQKLAVRDTNEDGMVSGTELDGLYAWVDRNHDASIQQGELSSFVSLGIEIVTLPAGGEKVGRFGEKGAGIGQMLWDWWPNYAIAKRKPAGGTVEPPASFALGARPLPPDMLPFFLNFPSSPDGWVEKQTLEGAGMDWRSLGLAALSPDGSRILLVDREPDPAVIRSGEALRLWVLWKDGEGFAGKRIPLPLSVEEDIVFLTPESALVVGDTGAVMIHVDLVAFQRTVLLEPGSAKMGFRAGCPAWRDGSSVYLTGYFHNPSKEGGRNWIVRHTGFPQSSELLTAADLDAMRAAAGALGDIAMIYLASAELGFFMVRDPDQVSYSIVSCLNGNPTVLDRAARLGVLAAGGSRVLYSRAVGGSEEGEAIVKDAVSGEEYSLGRGDYTYPYLEDGGRAAFVTRIDWSTGRMTFLGAGVHKGSTFEEIFTAPDIGVIRVSGDGGSFSYLGPRGLHLGPTRIARPREFLRGDANADDAADISDAVAILGHLFLGARMNDCQDAADVNDDGKVDISDPVALLGYLFLGSKRPPDPFGKCGPDTTADDLDCKNFTICP